MISPWPPGAELRTTEQLKSLFETHLDEIEGVVSWISRRSCIRGDELEDFRSWVHVKLIDDDYHVLRSHSGRSSLATYLTTVVQNLARDYRTRRWGRWRPSANAERYGVVAIQLQTFMERDGFSLGEAAEMLRRHHGVRMTEREIFDLAGRLQRRPRISIQSGEQVEDAAAQESAGNALTDSDGEAMREQARRALDESLRELEVEDRLILRMHYESGLPMRAIASVLGHQQRSLYTRRDRSLRQLRAGLERRGLDARSVLEMLEWSRGELEVDFHADSSKAPDSGPSNPANEDANSQ